MFLDLVILLLSVGKFWIFRSFSFSFCGGSRNSYNVSTAKSTASLRSPVYKQLTIDGTSTESGTYLSKTMAAGVQNLPNHSLVESH